MMSLWRLSGAHGCNPDLCAIQRQWQLHSGVRKHELLLHGHVGICSMWGGESGMWENRKWRTMRTLASGAWRVYTPKQSRMRARGQEAPRIVPAGAGIGAAGAGAVSCCC